MKRGSGKGPGPGALFSRLLKIMERLRGEEGCPWDREQTIESLKPFLIEECYEVLAAIDRGDARGHREELGDLLLQIVFQAKLRSEEGAFTMADVIRGLTEKLTARHPHVFSGVKVETAGAALENWERLKGEEKGDRDTLAGTPGFLPSLLRAFRLTEKASRLGFDWEDRRGVLNKIEEERVELEKELDMGSRKGIEEEYGDLLFALANLGRFIGVNPEIALQKANDRFIRRFRSIQERLAGMGISPGKGVMDLMDRLWKEAKEEEEGGKGKR